MERRIGSADRPVLLERIQFEERVQKVAQEIRGDWKIQAANIRRKIEKRRFLHRGEEVPLSEKKSMRLQTQLNVLSAKLNGFGYPGKAARQHVYRTVGPVEETDLRGAFNGARSEEIRISRVRRF